MHSVRAAFARRLDESRFCCGNLEVLENKPTGLISFALPFVSVGEDRREGLRLGRRRFQLPNKG
jgi:hypothetical protein